MSGGGAEKIALVFKPLLDESVRSIKEHNIAQVQEILFVLQKLNSRLDVLEKLVGEKKKAPKSEKKAPVEHEIGHATDAIIQHSGTKVFPINKLVYFRGQFKENLAFRQKYVTANMQALMDKDEQITSKTKEEQKLIAMASWCWKYIKNNAPDIYETMDKEYSEAKQLFEVANKPPEQTAEPRTP